MLLLDRDERAWSRQMGRELDAPGRARAEADRVEARVDEKPRRAAQSNRQTGARSGWVRRRNNAIARAAEQREADVLAAGDAVTCASLD